MTHQGSNQHPKSQASRNRQPSRRPRLTLLAACLAGLLLPATTASAAGSTAANSLAFNPAAGVARTATVSGRSFSYLAWEGIVYVAKPVDSTWQRMNIYIPVEYTRGQPLNGWTAATAPIFLPNQVGGYMPGKPGPPGQGMEGGDNAILVALSRGMVVASPGTRGRTTTDQAGSYTGKAPAAIVDLKAAVRYLRYNDQAMPGNAERIVSNGTSAGGALSALLGASGNNADYEPWLQALGAAPARDDVYAVSAYCPITNLDNADTAYEWLLGSLKETKSTGPNPGFAPGGTPPQGLTPPAGGTPPAGLPPAPAGTTGGTAPTLPFGAPASQSGPLSASQVQVSARLQALFPAYLDSLGLKAADGTSLSLDQAGNGSFRDLIKSLLIASAQRALDAGTSLAAEPWVTVKDGRVTDIDWNQYLAHSGRKKAAPAFDTLDASSGENNLFGTTSTNNRHFTAFGQANDSAKAPSADAATVRLMNPMNYLGTPGTSTAGFWRIRHGTIDSDTALVIPVILATRLANTGHTVDFALPWDKHHSGDYDLPELFDWIARICR